TQEKFLEEMASIPEEMRVTWRMHRVEEGDTLSLIARKYRTTPFAIAQANSLTNRKTIQIGAKLIIPVTPGKTNVSGRGANGAIRYAMKPGDTITSVANDYEVTVTQIRKWNRLGLKSQLSPGKVLVIYPPDVPAKPERVVLTGKSVAASNSARVIHQVKKGETLFAI